MAEDSGKRNFLLTHWDLALALSPWIDQKREPCCHHYLPLFNTSKWFSILIFLIIFYLLLKTPNLASMTPFSNPTSRAMVSQFALWASLPQLIPSMFMFLRAISVPLSFSLDTFPGKSHPSYYYLLISKFLSLSWIIPWVADLLSGHIHLSLKLNMTKTQNWTYHHLYPYPKVFFHSFSLFILINYTCSRSQKFGNCYTQLSLFPWFDLGLVLAV